MLCMLRAVAVRGLSSVSSFAKNSVPLKVCPRESGRGATPRPDYASHPQHLPDRGANIADVYRLGEDVVPVRELGYPVRVVYGDRHDVLPLVYLDEGPVVH